MIKPTMNSEKRLWGEGYTLVGGIDEAGRGSWAGPVVAAVVILPKNHLQDSRITDSKLISPRVREILYSEIINQAISYGVGIISHETIDRVGILNATKMAAAESVKNLKTSPDYLLCDALDLSDLLKLEQEAIIKGDQKVYSISCASIIAKVTRDRLMTEYDNEFGIYDFSKHKGYGTKLHQSALDIYGPCKIHRKSYAPIKKYL